MLSLIVAYDKNRTIGSDNSIPWRLKNDMLRVKTLTQGETIVMGRKTFESIGIALPNRENRVLTTNKESLEKYKGIKVFSDGDEILKNVNTEKIFIFGGAAIYEKYLSVVDEMFITEVEAETVGDTKFPIFSLEDWELISEEKFLADDSNEYNYKFLHYIRKKDK